MKTMFRNAPPEYASWLSIPKASMEEPSSPPWDFVHVFVNTTHQLEEDLFQLRHQIEPAGMIWVSLYKKSSGKLSEVTEDTIRDTALPIGLVDIKVCSVSPEWSALKLVIQKKLR
jgi:hypothetical protein